ncbi:type II toxin-antitoxin system HicA family toxin [Candidatus Woesearchaeota archaeon]|nr:type II toxin-antitoxin system HicA family toxin [Candidatus Woesearchaeota archaeon]HLD10725.1 type II toxin-antitoxin system HicA family toxin [Candidatus Nanoarchaeia archaeon]
MNKIPRLTAKEIIKAVNKLGFKFERQRGSHMFFRHEDERTTTIPNHPGEEIGSGLLNKIIKEELKITREEFIKYL